MIKLKKITLLIFSLLVNCSTYQITENKISNEKNILWISTTVNSDFTETYLRSNNSANLSLQIVNQLNLINNKKYFRVLYHKDQKQLFSHINIHIKSISSISKFPEKSLMPTITTAGLFLVFGGDLYEDVFRSEIEISISDENNQKKGSINLFFQYENSYSFYEYVYPFIDYRFMNFSYYNPSSSLAFTKFLTENIQSLLENET